MLDNDSNFDSLVSIIKVEEPEFQTIINDDLMRLKANIFSDPVVLVKRLTPETTTFATSKSDKNYRNESWDEATAFAVKGNEGLRWKDPHTCCFCQMVYSNRRYLKDHIESVHCKAKKMSCDFCPKFFFTKKSILNHMKLHSQKTFECNVCDYKTAVKGSLQRHKLGHATKVECLICKKQVTSMQNHIRVHKPKGSCPICKKMIIPHHLPQHMKNHTRAHKCGNCEENFDDREALRRHNLTNHYEGQLFKCHCGSVFNSKKQLKRHQEHHNEKQACGVCQKLFSTLNSLNMHWTRKHLKTHGRLEKCKIKVLNGTGPFICDKCGLRFSSRASFRTHHWNKHHSVLVFCDLCPRSFTKKYLLKRHMKLDHLKPCPSECNLCSQCLAYKKECFECNVCDYKSAVKSHLETHKLTHAAKVECPTCKKQVTSLQNHMRTHKPKNGPVCQKVVNEQNFSKHIKTHVKAHKCGKCEEIFEKREALRRHNLTKHYDGKLFECHCGSVYKFNCELIKHQQIHNGKLICRVCQKPFSTSNSLYTHWRVKHLKAHGKLESEVN